MDKRSYLPPDSLPAVIQDSLKTDSVPLSPSGLDKPVRYQARDSIRFDIPGQKVYLYGAAETYYDNIILKAERIWIDWKKNTIYARGVPDSSNKLSGTPYFSEGEKHFYAEEMDYNFRTKRGRLSKILTKEGEGYVTGEKVIKDSNDQLYIKNATYTTCIDTTHPHFYFRLSKIKIIPKEKIVAGPAQLVVEDVPTPGVLPFGFFPIKNKRSSGILLPKYGNAANRGFYLMDGGYYFAINDYIDLALTGTVYTGGSFGLRGASNYAKRYRYNGNFALSFADNRFIIPNSYDPLRQRDYLVQWTHRQDAKARPGTSFSANVKAGSSKYLSYNGNNPNDIQANNLNSSISYGKNWGPGSRYSLIASLRHDQNVTTREFNLTLPEVTFSVNRINPFKRRNQVGLPKWYENISASYAFNTRNVLKSYDSLLFKPGWTENFNTAAAHTVNLNTNLKVLKYFNLTPSAVYNEYWFTKTMDRSWDSSRDTLLQEVNPGLARFYNYNIGAQLNTNIFSMLTLKRGPIKAVRHVLNPVVGFLYIPGFGNTQQQWFQNVQVDPQGRFQRFSRFENGYSQPTYDAQGNLTFDLNNNIEMKVKNARDTVNGTTKLQLFDQLRFSSAYNIFADSMAWRPVTLTATTQLLKKINIRFNGLLDPYGLNAAGNVVKDYAWDVNDQLFRFTQGQFNIGTSLSAAELKKRKEEKRKSRFATDGENREMEQNPEGFINFNNPWDFSVNYVLNYDKPGLRRELTQNINLNASFNVTENWKIVFNGTYNITNKELAYCRIEVYRSLHCWDFKVEYTPIGFRQSFMFTLNIRSQTLQDLKLTRQIGY